MNDLDDNLVVREFKQRLLQRFYRALYICLDDQIQFLQAAFLNLAEQRIQRHSGLGIFQKLALALRNKGRRKVLGVLICVCCHQNLSGIRHIIES